MRLSCIRSAFLLHPYSAFAMSAGSSDNHSSTPAPSCRKDAPDEAALVALKEKIQAWGRELGFQQLGVAGIDLGEHQEYLNQWLSQGMHGEMGYMAAHGSKRWRPDELVPGTCRVITARMDYLPPEVETTKVLGQPERAYISRYALGRDYHKVIRKRLTTLAQWIEAETGSQGYRAFVDSAPVLERALAQRSGLGWFGKNSMLLNPKAGSLFFLGELFTDLPLPVDEPFTREHCGSCNQCQVKCPTGAIVDDKVVDARRCISYLTIELKDSIPLEFRRAMGNRVYGCDDCQLVCPFTRFTKASKEDDFAPRHELDRARLIDLFNWSEEEFLANTAGSAIRRIGHERWLRNLAVGLGNQPWSREVIAVLEQRLDHPSPLVQEHVQWALAEQHLKGDQVIGSA